MKITAARSFLLVVPVGREIADSMQSVTTVELVGLVIDTDAGVSGTGYTVTVGHGGRVIRSVLDTLFIDDLIGKDPNQVREIWQQLYFGKSHWIGRAGATTMAQSAVDIALWDILAKAANKPLWQLLGGARSSDIPIYNTNAGWLNFSVDQLCAEAEELLAEGYTALKMKVGRDSVAEDVARVGAVRKAVGDRAMLMVDANQRWDPMQAAEGARRLEEFDLGWLEEPLHPDDVPAHRALKQRTSLPIALGEHVYTVHAFRDFITSGAVDVVQVDVCRVGGITPWLEVASLAHAQGLRVCPHAGDLMQVHQHLVRAIPNSWLLEVIPLWRVGPFQQQIQLERGRCIAPMAPGASTDFTAAAFERFSVS
ncbi:MAG TPA: mandelate racemase/muconate lactonizing enzyme family protein [Steroidobacter sp.]|uniref:mandelate racemase/muconate lactonizing enzyme family protein n=1 Tax=Steroidobacter sp. TaxID=1978227 RepID=UPI002EDB4C19